MCRPMYMPLTTLAIRLHYDLARAFPCMQITIVNGECPVGENICVFVKGVDHVAINLQQLANM